MNKTKKQSAVFKQRKCKMCKVCPNDAAYSLWTLSSGLRTLKKSRSWPWLGLWKCLLFHCLPQEFYYIMSSMKRRDDDNSIWWEMCKAATAAAHKVTLRSECQNWLDGSPKRISVLLLLIRASELIWSRAVISYISFVYLSVYWHYSWAQETTFTH